MKRFFASFFLVLLCVSCGCRALPPLSRVPQLNVFEMFCIEEAVPFIDEEKIKFMNSLIDQVWNEDFGKFTQLFYKHFFKLPKTRNCKFEDLAFTQDTVFCTEIFLKYLYTAPTKSCLVVFRSWVDFYKDFHCTARKKEIIFDSLKEFICRFLVEMSKNFYITTELLRERTAIMCELYDLEDKKMFSLQRDVVV